MNRFLSFSLLPVLCLALSGCNKPSDNGSSDVADGYAALDARDYKKAASYFADAAKKCPTNFDARVQLAMARLSLGDLDAAETAVTNALAVCPVSAEALLLEGQIAYQKRDYARAAADFQAVAAAEGAGPELRSSALSSLAIVAFAQNQFNAARIFLYRAIRLHYRNAAAWYQLGVLSRDTYHFTDAALEQFETACRLSDPAEERTRKMSREIIPALRNAVAQEAASKPGVAKRNPGAAAKLIAAAEAALKKKQNKTALQKYSEAFAADPMSYPAAMGYAKSLESMDKTATGVDKALAAYRAAIDQRPSSQATYLAAAKLAYARGRYATAVAIMDRALAHVFDNRQILDLMIASQLKTGKAKEAAAWQEYRKELK